LSFVLRTCQWHGWESNPQNHEVLSFAALPDCVPGQFLASPIGFEPTTFAVTGRRALRAAPRGRIFECSSPGWTRTTDRHFVRVLPSPLGHRTRKMSNVESRISNRSGSRETRTRNGVIRTCFRDRFLIRPDDFRYSRTGLPTRPLEQFRGLESNQRPPGSEPGVTTSSNCPGITFPSLRHTFLRAVRSQVRGAGFEPARAGSKPASLPLADPRDIKLRRQESNLRRGG
jgi:hypothetical protein